MSELSPRSRRKTICQLIAAMQDLGSWAGETHIQKCVLFLQFMFEVPLGYRFRIHLHGPYSFELRDELAIMRARYHLDVIPQSGYGPSFTLGDRGQLSIDSPTPYSNAIQFVASHISTNDVRTLERISTAYFIRYTRADYSNDKIASEIHRLKPHIRIEEALKAMEDVEELLVAANEM